MQIAGVEIKPFRDASLHATDFGTHASWSILAGGASGVDQKADAVLRRPRPIDMNKGPRRRSSRIHRHSRRHTVSTCDRSPIQGRDLDMLWRCLIAAIT